MPVEKARAGCSQAGAAAGLKWYPGTSMRKWFKKDIPVIDLFAGPGGLGEGFASCDGYRIALSVEMDKYAHQTLQLRAFFRQFKSIEDVPEAYYEHVRDPGTLTRQDLFGMYPKQSEAARFEACHAEMGTPEGDTEIDGRLDRLEEAGVDFSRGVLIGGPPCQGYSLVGRSRRKPMQQAGVYDESKDGRHVAYQQYLRILQKRRPAMFVMENVKGNQDLDIQGPFDLSIDSQGSRGCRLFTQRSWFACKSAKTSRHAVSRHEGFSCCCR